VRSCWWRRGPSGEKKQPIARQEGGCAIKALEKTGMGRASAISSARRLSTGDMSGIIPGETTSPSNLMTTGGKGTLNRETDCEIEKRWKRYGCA